METRANYVLVGGFVFLVIAGLIAFVLWLGKAQFDREFTHYKILFRGSVTGLKEANPVRYRGVPVGAVTGIRISPSNVEEVEVLIRVPRETPVKEDTEASLEFQGITGVAYIQLSGGTHDSPPLKPKSGEKHAVLPSRRSQLEKVITDAPELLHQLIILVDKASQLLGESNQKSIAETLDNVRSVTGALANRSGDVEIILMDAASTMTELRDTIASLNRLIKDLNTRVADMSDETNATLSSARRSFDAIEKNVSRVSDELAPTLVETRSAASSISGMAEEIETLIAENRVPIRDFSAEGLYELSELLVELRTLVASMSRLTAKMESDPARFLFGDTMQSGVEAQ